MSQHRLMVAATLLALAFGPAISATAPPAEEAAAAAAASTEGGWPEWTDRLLFNARERTQRGRQAWAKDQAAEAVAPFDEAQRLQPEDPSAQFNAGTARLAAGSSGAAELLAYGTAVVLAD